MATLGPDAGFTPARRILPLGILLCILVLIPLGFVVLDHETLAPDGDLGTLAAYLVAAFSAVIAFGVAVLLLLWIAEYADEEVQKGERPGRD